MTKIMLVEDDKSLREIYGIRLLAEGYEIKSAGDGEEALAMAIKERPDLILSDVMMPKISGFDMLDILRSTPETKDIKVIMMTALSSEDQRTRGESLGANRYLVKSQVGIEDVVRTVHDVLADVPVAKVPASQMFGVPTPSAAIPVQPKVIDFKPLTTPAQTQTQPIPTPPISSSPIIAPFVTAPNPTPQPQPQPQPPIEPMPAPVFKPTPNVEPQSQPINTPEITLKPATIETPKIVLDDESHPTPAPVFAPQPISGTTPIQTTEMPQPTAPFSTSAPTSLGNNMMNPSQPTATVPDIATLMAQELKSASDNPTTPQNPIQ